MLNDFSGDNSNNGACPLWISEEWCDLRGYALDDFWELFVLNWRRLEHFRIRLKRLCGAAKLRRIRRLSESFGTLLG